MTPEQASELAKRIANCFRGCPPLGEWVDVFTHDLTDHQAALETFRRLRYTDGALSIERFAGEYDAVVSAGVVPAHLEPLAERLTRAQRNQLLLQGGAKPSLISQRTETP